MSKVSFVSGSLHRISGQISEAANRMHNPQQEPEESHASVPEEVARTGADSAVRHNPPAPDYAAMHAVLKPRYEELLRMKRDLTGQLREAEARFSAEAARLDRKIAEQNATLEELRSILARLENCRIPEFADADFKTALREALRTFENGRIELIRATMGVSKAEENTSQAAPAGTALGAMSAGELIRKGFAFFLPLIVTILLAALFLAAAFFLAWKVAL